MNKDQIEGTVKKTIGAVQEKVGNAINSSKQQAKGFEKQVEGNVQKEYGDVKEALKETKKY